MSSFTERLNATNPIDLPIDEAPSKPSSFAEKLNSRVVINTTPALTTPVVTPTTTIEIPQSDGSLMASYNAKAQFLENEATWQDELRNPEQWLPGGSMKRTDAFFVGVGRGMKGLYHGIQQMGLFTGDRTPEQVQRDLNSESVAFKALLDSKNLGMSTQVGQFIGWAADPVALAVPIGNIGRGVSVLNAAAKAGMAGFSVGFMDEVLDVAPGKEGEWHVGQRTKNGAIAGMFTAFLVGGAKYAGQRLRMDTVEKGRKGTAKDIDRLERRGKVGALPTTEGAGGLVPSAGRTKGDVGIREPGGIPPKEGKIASWKERLSPEAKNNLQFMDEDTLASFLEPRVKSDKPVVLSMEGQGHAKNPDTIMPNFTRNDDVKVFFNNLSEFIGTAKPTRSIWKEGQGPTVFDLARKVNVKGFTAADFMARYENTSADLLAHVSGLEIQSRISVNAVKNFRKARLQGLDDANLFASTMNEMYKTEVMRNYIETGVSEIGRAMRTLQDVSRYTDKYGKPINATQRAKNITDHFNEIGGSVGAMRTSNYDDMAEMLSQVAVTATDDNIARLSNAATDVHFTEKMQYVMLNTLLSDPSTHFLNFTSNALMQGLFGSSRHVQAIGGATIDALAKNDFDRLPRRYLEGFAFNRGQGMGAISGAKLGLRILAKRAVFDVVDDNGKVLAQFSDPSDAAKFSKLHGGEGSQVIRPFGVIDETGEELGRFTTKQRAQRYMDEELVTNPATGKQQHNLTLTKNIQEAKTPSTKIELLRREDVTQGTSETFQRWGGRVGSARAGKILAEAYDIPGRALVSSDELFKEMTRQGELRVWAYRKTVQEIKQSKRKWSRKERASRMQHHQENPTPSVAKRAEELAEEATFTSDLPRKGKKPGQSGAAIAHRIQDWSNSHLAFKATIPFIRTPVNIFKTFARHSPLGAVADAGRAQSAVSGKAKGIRGKLIDDLKASELQDTSEIARDMFAQRTTEWFVGSVAMAGMYWLAGEGAITGGGPVQGGLKEVWKASGIEAYSIDVHKILGIMSGIDAEDLQGVPKWISFSRADPFGMSLGIIADARQLMDSGLLGDAAANEEVNAFITTMMRNNLLNKTYMQSFQEFFNMFDATTPEHFVEKITSTMAMGIPIAGLAFSPPVGNLARVLDDHRKIQTKSDPSRTTIPQNWQQVWDEMKYTYTKKLPIFRGDILPDRNIIGEVVYYAGRPSEGVAEKTVAAFNPFYLHSGQVHPAVMAMMQARVTLRMPSQKIGKITLTPEQYDFYSERVGTYAKDMVVSLLNTGDVPGTVSLEGQNLMHNSGLIDAAGKLHKQGFNRSQLHVRREMIRRSYAYARSMAKIDLAKEFKLHAPMIQDTLMRKGVYPKGVRDDEQVIWDAGQQHFKVE